MLAIINAELVMHDHLIPDAVLFVEDGTICGFGEMRTTPIPDGCEVLDAQGAYVAPGFIDIHCHAGGEHWFYDDPIAAAGFSLSHGTTTVLPTLYYDMDQAQLVESVCKIQNAMHQPGGANIGGFYMETPYMNPKYGSNSDRNAWKGAIRRQEYMPLLEAAGTDVKVWVVAPEREGIEGFMRDAKKVNPNVRFSVGHSEATPQQVEKLMPYGLCIGTHHTNATGTLAKYGGCRGVCVDEAVNYNRDIYAELICDSRGIHVNPYMLRLIRRIKGDDRIMLISDASYFSGVKPEGYEDVTDLCFDHMGGIAGSRLTLDVACRNMMKHTGASIVDVCNYASYNPSKVLGMTDRGEIAVGKRADLVVIDHKINVKKVILEGVIQK